MQTAATIVGQNLLATALQTPGANVAITYISIGAGLGTLSSALTSGQSYTSLALNAGIPIALVAGQSITLIDANADSQTVTVATGGAAQGATSIPVSSFTANATYAAGSGVVTTPSANDQALNNELVRLAAPAGVAGAATGESLNSAYFSPATPSGTYIEVGYWGGSTATASLGTGILIARDIQYWNHTLNQDSYSFQLDSTL
jgi:hypothetical protein